MPAGHNMTDRKSIVQGIADQAGLNDMEGVAKVLISGGVFQVVIGTHVKEVFEEIEKLVTPKTGGEDARPKETFPKSILWWLP